MEQLTLAEVATLFNVTLKEEKAATVVLHQVCIDSRQVTAGDLFVAIVGARYDGHQFIPEAIKNGAVAILCMTPIADTDVVQIRVEDTLAALGTLAKYYRGKCTCPIIALTGSNGKTTTKEMIASVLPKPSFATRGNFNNHIGVPLSLLQLNNEHRYAVFELGANHAGEIAYTAALVKPNVTLITNIAPAHIEGFGSIEGVACAKGEIHQHLMPGGIAVINEDDKYAHFWDKSLVDKKCLRYSAQKTTDIHLSDLRKDKLGCAQFTIVFPCHHRLPIHLKVVGAHHVSNALAAAACAYAIGIGFEEISRGLSSFTGVPGRMAFRVGLNESCIIDDTYNANLNSVQVALAVLAARPGRKIFVLGDMGELGQWTITHHQEIGSLAKQLGIDELITCGHHSYYTAEKFGPQGYHYKQHEEVISHLRDKLDANTTVLVKGSRKAAMEKIVQCLLNEVVIS